MSGTVTDAHTSAAVSGATVSAPGVTSVTTNSAGAYSLSLVPHGTLVTVTYTNYYVTATATPSITAGATTSNFNFSLTPVGTVSGTVTDAGNSAAISGATVSAPGVTSATTSSTGTYTLSNVPYGTWSP